MSLTTLGCLHRLSDHLSNYWYIALAAHDALLDIRVLTLFVSGLLIQGRGSAGNKAVHDRFVGFGLKAAVTEMNGGVEVAAPVEDEQQSPGAQYAQSECYRERQGSQQSSRRTDGKADSDQGTPTVDVQPNGSEPSGGVGIQRTTTKIHLDQYRRRPGGSGRDRRRRLGLAAFFALSAETVAGPSYGGTMVDASDLVTPDAAQRSVIDHGSGVLAVSGGPGTGKTTALLERFVTLATSEGCTADRILLLVPNRTEKMELQRSLARRLLFDEGLAAVIDIPVYTWHGLAYHLVSRNYDKLGYQEPPVLLTSPEQWGSVREALAKEDPANWPHHRHLLRNRGFVDEVVDFFIRVGQRGMEPSELEPLGELRPQWRSLISFYRRHHNTMRQRNRVDYPTLMRDAVELIANWREVRDGLQRRFMHLLVDDGQELALIQQRLLFFLSMPPEVTSDDTRSLVVAGDPDSAIETFRGAEPRWMDSLEKEFGTHESIVLNTSYRLGPQAGAMASALISNNGEATHRPTSYDGGSTIEVKRYANLAAEAEAVARALRLAHLTEKIPFDEMAILLTSARSMLPAFERALDTFQVPFSVSAPDRPLGREPIVRAFTDLAKFAFSDDPDPEALQQLLRSPLIDLADLDVRELERHARVAKVTLAQLLADHSSAEISDSAREKIGELSHLTEALRSARSEPADHAFWTVWDRSTVCARLRESARADIQDPSNRDLDALVAFSRALGRFVERRNGKGTFEDYLDSMGRADFGSDPWLPPERSKGGVQVLSFHGAKGKQWQLVAVCGAIEGSIPKGRRATGLFDPYFLDETDPVQRSRKNEQEDRRVFYVATTRASRLCIVTTSPGPTRRGEPSRFLTELTGEPLEVEVREVTQPLTFTEAAARYRRVLADTKAAAPERIAAIAGLAEIVRLDPSCAAARPEEWWWRWDWTEGSVPIRTQQADANDDLPHDKLRTSYSRISTYDNCGLQYLFSIVLGLDPESSHNMAFGSWIHKIFEEIEIGDIPKGDFDALNARYRELFDPTIFPNRAMARQFWRDGQIMLQRYIDHLKPNGSLKAEVAFKVELEGHRITGRIDRIDPVGSKGKVVVTDYKTSRNPLHWNDAKESLQLAIYHLAVTTDPELKALGEPYEMRLVYPASMSRGQVATRAQTPEQAQEAIKRLPGLMEGVLAEDFRPNPEADCMWCKFKPLCPLWSEGKELPA